MKLEICNNEQNDPTLKLRLVNGSNNDILLQSSLDGQTWENEAQIIVSHDSYTIKGFINFNKNIKWCIIK